MTQTYKGNAYGIPHDTRERLRDLLVGVRVGILSSIPLLLSTFYQLFQATRTRSEETQ